MLTVHVNVSEEDGGGGLSSRGVQSVPNIPLIRDLLGSEQVNVWRLTSEAVMIPRKGFAFAIVISGRAESFTRLFEPENKQVAMTCRTTRCGQLVSLYSHQRRPSSTCETLPNNY